jgi:hypothetical protein
MPSLITRISLDPPGRSTGLRVVLAIEQLTGGRRSGGAGGSPMGRVYRETTPAMLTRVNSALDERIGRAEQLAASLLREG